MTLLQQPGYNQPATPVLFCTDETVSESLTVAGQSLSYYIDKGYKYLGIQIVGTWTGQLEFEVTIDRENWESFQLKNNIGGNLVNATVGNGIFTGLVAGLSKVRVRASVLSSGSANVSLRASI
jgi:hypothetical protein